MKLIFLIFTIFFGLAMAQQGCICPAVYMPVCATSGQTYSNRCQLACAKAKFAHPGPCR